MDPLNHKFEAFERDIKFLKSLNKKDFFKWYKTYGTSFRPIYNDMIASGDINRLSYKNIQMFRFMKALITEVKCIKCQDTYGFGLNDSFCDNCVSSFKCEGPAYCITKVGTGKSSTCAHHNFASENEILGLY